MPTLTAILDPHAQPVSITAMNGRGDTLGVTLQDAVLDPIAPTPLDRGDELRVLPNPDRSRAQLRVYLDDAAIDRDRAWRPLSQRGSARTVTSMNGRGDTLGVSLPADVMETWMQNCDAVTVPADRATIDVFLPATPESE